MGIGRVLVGWGVSVCFRSDFIDYYNKNNNLILEGDVVEWLMVF